MFLLRKATKNDKEDLLNLFNNSISYSTLDINFKESFKSNKTPLIKDMAVLADGDDFCIQGFTDFILTNDPEIVYCPFLIVDKDHIKDNVMESLLKDAITSARYIGKKAILINGLIENFKKLHFKKASEFNIHIKDIKDDDLLVLFIDEEMKDKDLVVDFNFDITTNSPVENEKIKKGELTPQQKKFKKTSRLILAACGLLVAICLIIVVLKNFGYVNDLVSFEVTICSLGTALILLGVLQVVAKRKVNAYFGFICGALLYLIAIIFPFMK